MLHSTEGDAQKISKNRANDVDRHVGSKIRQQRVRMGLSQQQVAELIGVTYQQAHKYERGINRISVGRLWEMARVLSVPVDYFFEGMGEDVGTPELQPKQRMCLELARNFMKIREEDQQDALSRMARALASD
jgi:transcriptional regulator with XRE-family HTH domain